jgi:hypothetical protein
MGRQHWVQQTGSREEHIARLRAQGVTDAEIAALIAQVEADAATREAHQQAVGAPPAAEPKQRYRVRNWRAYNQALIQRGSLTLWFYEDSIRHWCANERPEETGRPTVYSDLAIQCMLTIKAVFQVALRQTQGLVASLIQLMGLTLPTPNYTTVSRRSATVDVDLETRARTEPMHVVWWWTPLGSRSLVRANGRYGSTAGISGAPGGHSTSVWTKRPVRLSRT